MYSIMVVEDNFPVRKGLIQNIKLGLPEFQVVGEASDGISGKELALSLRPEILLTDIRLPGISGLKMIREIREIYTPQVVVISGYSEFEYAREALSLGVLAYLVKPIDEEELESTLKHAASCICSARSLQTPVAPLRPDATGEIAKKGASMQAYYVEQTIRYIHEHFAENLGLSDMAEALRISESYLSRIFKEQTSFTINEYRTSYRIAQAARMLADPGYKIYEVARGVGIENSRYFSNLFKQNMGVTPMEYRRALLSGQVRFP
ncbi:MAG: response regulator [Lachnospiraceae bacterium]|nr:response regulator [Lachnospiraceae bacterium]